MWTGLQFDSAVLTFGRWADNELKRTDSEGRPVTTLERVLDLQVSPREWGRRNEATVRLLKFMAAQQPHPTMKFVEH